MRSLWLRIFASTLAMIGLSLPSVVMAKSCVEPDDLGDAIVYFMPSAFAAYSSQCAGEIKNDSYFAREQTTILKRYANMHSQASEGAFRFISTIAQERALDDNSVRPEGIFDTMPQESLRQLIAPIVEVKLAETIKLSDCKTIAQLIEPMAQMKPNNVAVLISSLLQLVSNFKNPEICKSTAK